MIDSICNWIIKAIANGLEAFANYILGFADLDLSKFYEYFGVLGDIFPVFLAIATGLTIGIGIFQLAKFFTGSLSETRENPVQIVLRVGIAIAMIYYGNYFLQMIVNLFSYPFNALMSVEGADMSFSFGFGDDGADFIAGVGSALIGITSGATASHTLIALILLIAFAWNLVKLLIEVIERYLMVGVLVYTAPLVYSTISSSSTAQIFKKWCSMFMGQCLLMLINVFSIKMVFSIFQSTTSDVIVRILIALAFCKIAAKFDSYMNTLGLSTAITGSNMGGLMIFNALMANGARLGFGGKAKAILGSKAGANAPLGKNGATPGNDGTASGKDAASASTKNPNAPQTNPNAPQANGSSGASPSNPNGGTANGAGGTRGAGVANGTGGSSSTKPTTPIPYDKSGEVGADTAKVQPDFDDMIDMEPPIDNAPPEFPENIDEFANMSDMPMAEAEANSGMFGASGEYTNAIQGAAMADITPASESEIEPDKPFTQGEKNAVAVLENQKDSDLGNETLKGNPRSAAIAAAAMGSVASNSFDMSQMQNSENPVLKKTADATAAMGGIKSYVDNASTVPSSAQSTGQETSQSVGQATGQSAGQSASQVTGETGNVGGTGTVTPPRTNDSPISPTGSDVENKNNPIIRTANGGTVSNIQSDGNGGLRYTYTEPANAAGQGDANGTDGIDKAGAGNQTQMSLIPKAAYDKLSAEEQAKYTKIPSTIGGENGGYYARAIDDNNGVNGDNGSSSVENADANGHTSVGGNGAPVSAADIQTEADKQAQTQTPELKVISEGAKAQVMDDVTGFDAGGTNIGKGDISGTAPVHGENPETYGENPETSTLMKGGAGLADSPSTVPTNSEASTLKNEGAMSADVPSTVVTSATGSSESSDVVQAPGSADTITTPSNPTKTETIGTGEIINEDGNPIVNDGFVSVRNGENSGNVYVQKQQATVENMEPQNSHNNMSGGNSPIIGGDRSGIGINRRIDNGQFSSPKRNGGKRKKKK